MRAASVATTLTVLAGLLAGAPTYAADRPAPRPAPGTVDGWATTTPAAAGFDGRRLSAIARDAKEMDSTCLAVVRDGRLVDDWNWGTKRTAARQGFSVTKSVTSALVGIAVRDGDLRPGDRVSRYVPEWRGTPSASVTVRDLLSNTSGRFWSAQSDYGDLTQARYRTAYAVGLSQQYPRGTAWAYNNAAIQVLDRVLRQATGRPTAAFAADRLFEPLGMTHTFMTGDKSGRSTNVYFGLQSTCLDLARFARLYLQRGVVDGHRILSRSWVGRSTGRSSSELNAAYGYLWWLNRYGVVRGALDPVDAEGQPLETHRGRLVPDAAANVFAAIGLGGQVALVDPGSRTIVVRLGPAQLQAEYGVGDAARVVTEALRRPGS